MNPSPSALYVLPNLPRSKAPDAAQVSERLEPLRAIGYLDTIDLHVVTRLGHLLDEWDPNVLIACAAALNAPRHGHICLDLGANYPWVGETDHAHLWPQPTEAAQALSTSSMVGTPQIRQGPNGVLPFIFDKRRLYTTRLWDNQTLLINRLRQLAEAPILEPTQPQLLAKGLATLLSGPQSTSQPSVNRQQIAGALASLRQLTVITGGPGMGKTHTVRSLLALLFAQHQAKAHTDTHTPPLRVALAAPTGKAVARIRESLLKGLDAFLEKATAIVPDTDELRQFIIGLETRTLHRLLGVRREDPNRFRHNAEFPLPYDLVVVDETSMVDFNLMTRLMEAIAQDTRLVLLGDRHQLTSVEAGTVLADICGPVSSSRLPLSPSLRQKLADYRIPEDAIDPPESLLQDTVVQLNRTYRFSSDSSIGRFTAACLEEHFDAQRAAAHLFEGRPDTQHYDPGPGNTLPNPVLTAIVDAYRPMFEAVEAAEHVELSQETIAHRRALDTFDSFRVLCAHRQGPLGVEGVNAAVATYFNPPSNVGGPFWPGRPIIIRRNDYDAGLFNGDIGLVVTRRDGDTRQTAVAFPASDAGLVGDAAPPSVRYVAPQALPDHETCFALTIHKSQGSEYAHVMVVLPVEPSRIITRELLYTGITRAREQISIVTQRQLFENALAQTVKRASGLRDAIWPP